MHDQVINSNGHRISSQHIHREWLVQRLFTKLMFVVHDCVQDIDKSQKKIKKILAHFRLCIPMLNASTVGGWVDWVLVCLFSYRSANQLRQHSLLYSHFCHPQISLKGNAVSDLFTKRVCFSLCDCDLPRLPEVEWRENSISNTVDFNCPQYNTAQPNWCQSLWIQIESYCILYKVLVFCVAYVSVCLSVYLFMCVCVCVCVCVCTCMKLISLII